MVNQVVNGLIAAVVGAVAFIAVRALVLATGSACCGDPLSAVTTLNTSVITGDCYKVDCVLQTNVTNCSYEGTFSYANETIWASCRDCWSGAQCTMMVTIVPLAVAMVVVIGLFMGLTRVKGA